MKGRVRERFFLPESAADLYHGKASLQLCFVPIPAQCRYPTVILAGT